MNEDILIEKIKYLSTMPHSSLVEHCIYLENENDNYKAQKYITDFISENGIICEKNKEIERLKSNYEKIYNENCKLREQHNITDISLLDENERLNNIIDEIFEWMQNKYDNSDLTGFTVSFQELEDLKELKEGKE